MAEKQEAVRVDWRQSVGWLSLFRGFRLALDVKKMTLGFVALLATWGAFLALSLVWRLVGLDKPEATWLPNAGRQLVAVAASVPGAVLSGKTGDLEVNVRLLRGAVASMSKDYTGFTVVFGILMILIWSYFGGAISRMAAVQFSRDERISLTEALAFTGRKYVSLVFAPLIPVLAIIFVCIITGLVGLLAGIPYFGEWFAGLFWPLPLVVGFILALITIGGVFGLPLMHPTIGAEGSDAFDAISRSFSYVYSRPWRAAFYAIVATIYGVIVFTFVVFFAGLLLSASRFCVEFVGGVVFPGIGIGDKMDRLWPADLSSTAWSLHASEAFQSVEMTGSEEAAAYVLRFWVWVVWSLAWGFAVSYAYSALTVIYFLLRKNVDNTEFDEVYLEEEEEEFEDFDEDVKGFGEDEETKAEADEPADGDEDAETGDDAADEESGGDDEDKG